MKRKDEFGKSERKTGILSKILNIKLSFSKIFRLNVAIALSFLIILVLSVTAGDITVKQGILGVGTSNPTQTLSVFGSMNITGSDFTPILYNDGTFKTIGFGTYEPNLAGYGGGSRVFTILAYGTQPGDAVLELAKDGPLSDNHELADVAVSLKNNTPSARRITRIVTYTSGTNAGSAGGQLAFFTKPNGVTSASERMRITSTGNIGIGTSSPNSQLHTTGNVSLATTSGSVGVGRTSSSLIYKLNVKGIVNATAYVSNGTDYAELVLKQDQKESIETGDIVGVFDGKATKTTLNANGYYVVSGPSASFIGGVGSSDLYETTTTVDDTINETLTDVKPRSDFTGSNFVPIAFVGQVKVKAKGVVNSGDWIIPSGDNDGAGIAVNIESVTTLTQITKYLKQKVCIAWQSKADQGIAMINCAVGGGI